MIDRLTERARRVILKAQEISKQLGHGYIGSEHVLYGLTAVEGLSQDLLAAYGVNTEGIARVIVQLVGKRGQITNIPQNAIAMTPRTKRLIEGSMEIATSLNHDYIGPEHVLLALLSEQEGIAFSILKSFNVTSINSRTML